MNAPVQILSAGALANAVAVLEIRSEIRAWLWWRWLDFPNIADAVDPLQQFAEESGLVATIGQDRVQGLIGEPFARYRNSYRASSPMVLSGPLAPAIHLVELMLADGHSGAECVAAVRENTQVPQL